jgi:hypothetical protein
MWDRVGDDKALNEMGWGSRYDIIDEMNESRLACFDILVSEIDK